MWLFETPAGKTAVKMLVAMTAVLLAALGVMPWVVALLVAGVALLKAQATQAEVELAFAPVEA